MVDKGMGGRTLASAETSWTDVDNILAYWVQLTRFRLCEQQGRAGRSLSRKPVACEQGVRLGMFPSGVRWRRSCGDGMMFRRATTAIAATILWGACAGGVQAQDASTDLPPEDRWTFAVAPYLWALSLDGNTTVKGVEADVDVPFSDALKDLSFGAMLLVDARRGRFGIGVNGVFARTSPDDEVGPIKIEATSDLALLGIGPYYRAVEWQYAESASGRPLRLILEPWVGARLNHLRLELQLKRQGMFQDVDLGRVGEHFDNSETWVDPIIGTRFAVDLAERWIVAGEADVGGVVAGSDLSWNVQGYLGYRTSLLGQPTTFAIGYRALYVDYDHNEFKWDVTQQGPILGAVLRF